MFSRAFAKWFVPVVAMVCGGVLGLACSGPQDPVDNANDNGQVDGNANANENMNENASSEGLPLATFRTENFQGSGNCTTCHSGLTDAAGEDVSIGEDWRANLMSNAAKDPFFLAMMAAEVEKAPEALREVVQDSCATCHMPMARTQAVADGTDVRVLNGGFLDQADPLHEAAMDGVSCTACHQIQDDGSLGEPESFSGGFVIDTTATEPERPLFGPYQDPLENIMQVSVGYTPVFGEHMTTSAFCATCHTLFTPTLDADGTIVGEFPEQTPYLEWQHSIYGSGVGELTHCQDCHMPLAEGSVQISTVPGDLEPRSPFYRHQFRGANLFMLRMLSHHIDALELTASSENFASAIEATERFLRTSSANLEINQATAGAEGLFLQLRVENQAGHKLPASFPSRRVWIHLQVTDGGGEIVFESGAPQSDGRIAGNDADQDVASFEPHYETITTSDQVQIYEAIMANTDGEVTYTLLRADSYAKDNRLLPTGFDKATAGEDIQVHGAAAGDADFSGGRDTVNYDIDVAGTSGPYTVRAELLYHSVSYQFAEDLRADQEEELVSRFVQFFDEEDKTPDILAADQTILP